MKSLGISFSLLVLLSCSQSHVQRKVAHEDQYRSFAELAQDNVEGVDYSLEVKDRQSSILVMAFHGGYVEPGSAELGSEITKDKFNFYAFRALQPGKLHEPSFTYSTLHLTSTRYDEPGLLSMAAESHFCLSLHGFGGQEADFCMGGGNGEQRKVLNQRLSQHFPELQSCELCCPPFNGTSKKNPTNQCRNQGIQIEMSPRVRKRLLSDLQFRAEVANSLRGWLEDAEIRFTPSR